MTMLKKWIIASCALMALASLPGYAQEPTMVGSWSITFYLEPNHVQGATQCVVFTLVPNTVANEPVEGRWVSTTFPNWSGLWFQEGEHVQWFGSTGGGLATQEYGDLASANNSQGKFQHYFPLNPGARYSSAGAWIGTRVPSCVNAGTTTGTDPATASLSTAKTSPGNRGAKSTLAILAYGLATTTFPNRPAPLEIMAEEWAKFEAYL